MAETCPHPDPDDRLWDVVIIGAGINGAATAGVLARAGYQVLVVDRGDIGGGTSQASTMLVWGGLLYLKDFELSAVWELSRERDRLIATAADQVRVCQMRYMPTPGHRPRALILAALNAYWALGAGRRRRARRVQAFAEQAMFARHSPDAYAYEEATLATSDARFVLDAVRAAEAGGAAVRSYRRVDSCEFDRGRWRIALSDTLSGATSDVSARFVINAAGPWADRVNAAAHIETPYTHVLSRGVSLTLPRDPLHQSHLVFDTEEGNALTLAPWGPVALWASTESLHDEVEEASRIAPDDVSSLLDQYNDRFRVAVDVDDVVALRVGVRPVPVVRGQKVHARGLGLSRHHRLCADADRPWLTIFGGKLSGCHGLARDVGAMVGRRLSPSPAADHRTAGMSAVEHSASNDTPPTVMFPGVSGSLVDPAWSVAHEHCRTLADYVRRRTNVAQWTPRGGFGRHDEHAPLLRELARTIHRGDEHAASRDLAAYRKSVEDDDAILAAARAQRRSSSIGVTA